MVVPGLIMDDLIIHAPFTAFEYCIQQVIKYVS